MLLKAVMLCDLRPSPRSLSPGHAAPADMHPTHDCMVLEADAHHRESYHFTFIEVVDLHWSLHGNLVAVAAFPIFLRLSAKMLQQNVQMLCVAPML